MLWEVTGPQIGGSHLVTDWLGLKLSIWSLLHIHAWFLVLTQVAEAGTAGVFETLQPWYLQHDASGWLDLSHGGSEVQSVVKEMEHQEEMTWPSEIMQHRSCKSIFADAVTKSCQVEEREIDLASWWGCGKSLEKEHGTRIIFEVICYSLICKFHTSRKSFWFLSCYVLQHDVWILPCLQSEI
jgi:hypothetical protein